MSKPKIVVLHMRELIYTAIFIFLILVLLILLFLMFRPHDASNTPDTAIFISMLCRDWDLLLYRRSSNNVGESATATTVVATSKQRAVI